MRDSTNPRALTVSRILPWMHRTPVGIEEFDEPVSYPAYLLDDVVTGRNY